jgi:ferredoxin
VKTIADRALCKGHGQCELFAPDHFEIDDEALVVVRKEDVEPGALADVKDAISHCPEAALRLVEG